MTGVMGGLVSTTPPLRTIAVLTTCVCVCVCVCGCVHTCVCVCVCSVSSPDPRVGALSL